MTRSRGTGSSAGGRRGQSRPCRGSTPRRAANVTADTVTVRASRGRSTGIAKVGCGWTAGLARGVSAEVSVGPLADHGTRPAEAATTSRSGRPTKRLHPDRPAADPIPDGASGWPSVPIHRLPDRASKRRNRAKDPATGRVGAMCSDGGAGLAVSAASMTPTSAPRPPRHVTAAAAAPASPGRRLRPGRSRLPRATLQLAQRQGPMPVATAATSTAAGALVTAVRPCRACRTRSTAQGITVFALQRAFGRAEADQRPGLQGLLRTRTSSAACCPDHWSASATTPQPVAAGTTTRAGTVTSAAPLTRRPSPTGRATPPRCSAGHPHLERHGVRDRPGADAEERRAAGARRRPPVVGCGTRS
jgi:hypothetical protein